MPQVCIHIKTQEGGFQLKGKGIILTYVRSEDHGMIGSALDKRKVLHQFVARRQCTDEEMAIESHPHRVEFQQYRTWEALISDERKLTDDPAWFELLAKLQNEFPQFKQPQHGPTTDEGDRPGT